MPTINNLLSEYQTRYQVSDVCYKIEEETAFLNLRQRQTEANILNQLQYNFKWKSNDERVVFPRNYEILNRIFGTTGFLISEQKFVKISPIELDENNNVSKWVCLGFGTKPISYGDKENMTEVIPLYNNPLGLPDMGDISYFAYEKAQNDVSRMYQLINSRNIPWVKTDNDKVADMIQEALKDVKAGKQVVIKTKLMDELEKIDILDPSNIAKMEYLTSYDEVLDKNIANRFGASLDIKDKKAQVNNAELKAYDDITTMNYLVNYECRLEFVENMKAAGFDIEVIVSPIFADEPTEEEIEDPELLEEENSNNEEENSNNEESSNNEKDGEKDEEN